MKEKKKGKKGGDNFIYSNFSRTSGNRNIDRICHRWIGKSIYLINWNAGVGEILCGLSQQQRPQNRQKQKNRLSTLSSPIEKVLLYEEGLRETLTSHMLPAISRLSTAFNLIPFQDWKRKSKSHQTFAYCYCSALFFSNYIRIYLLIDKFTILSHPQRQIEWKFDWRSSKSRQRYVCMCSIGRLDKLILKSIQNFGIINFSLS